MAGESKVSNLLLSVLKNVGAGETLEIVVELAQRPPERTGVDAFEGQNAKRGYLRVGRERAGCLA